MITKLLCKHFDVEEKGYVTLGDIGEAILPAAIFIIFGAAAPFIIASVYLHGAWLIYNGALTSEKILDPIEFGCVMIFIVVSTLIAICIASYIISKLVPIRVATCERKDGDETL